MRVAYLAAVNAFQRLQLTALVVKPDTVEELGRALHQQLQEAR